MNTMAITDTVVNGLRSQERLVSTRLSKEGNVYRSRLQRHSSDWPKWFEAQLGDFLTVKVT